MPAKSGKQYRFMQMIAHGGKASGMGGPPEAVAKEFVDKTPHKMRMKFAKAAAGKSRPGVKKKYL